MRIDEQALKDNIKLNKLTNLYYFYGKEAFLVKTYTERVKTKFAPDLDEFNFIKFTGIPDFDSLSEAIETLPVFADRKVLFLNDFDAEKTDADTLERFILLFSDIPDYCTLIISITGFEPSVKNAKTKKLLSAVEANGTICEFDFLSRPKAVELITGKAARLGCIIERTDAEYLYDLCLGSLTLIGSEVEKLVSYVGGSGKITREVIELLTPRLTETSVYELASALTAKRTKIAFRILDDLISQNVSTVIILSSLSGAFTDFYRAKLGKNHRQSPEKTASDFNYAKNRAWLMKKIPSAELTYIKNCIKLLYRADIKIKSTNLNDRTVIEKVMADILVLK
ncbi:MAG: DNA polymerase III subunit delta [Oscillospiraceae bacterium]|nr:DNA polymerase III subunit delta [Oscillospiraceae bacterium]